MVSQRRIAVIGGGISGLACAYYLQQQLPLAEVKLFEASSRIGGVLRTERVGDYLVEHAADMFTTKDPWALDLCRELGLESELIETNQANRHAFIVRRGKLHRVPEGFQLMSPTAAWPIIRTPLLSIAGKLRMAWETFVPRRAETTDESLASFARRRFGSEVFEQLIQPLIGGIYTADPERLSMLATMPQFVMMEQKFGSVVRATLLRKTGEKQAAGSGARYGLFLAPRDGMQRLIEAVAAKLLPGTIELDTRVDQLESVPLGERKWKFRATRGSADPSAGNSSREEWFDDVVIALSARGAHPLLATAAPDLAAKLSQVEFASCSVVVMGVKRKDIAHPLNGFGLVCPAREGRKIIAASFASVKYPGRAPDDSVLIRTFVGGALQPELARLPDAALESLVDQELRELIGYRGPAEFTRICRWLDAMPQYHVGHLDLAKEIETLVGSLPRLALAGNSLRGVGIPFCIRSAKLAAERIVQMKA